MVDDTYVQIQDYGFFKENIFYNLTMEINIYFLNYILPILHAELFPLFLMFIFASFWTGRSLSSILI